MHYSRRRLLRTNCLGTEFSQNNLIHNEGFRLDNTAEVSAISGVYFISNLAIVNIAHLCSSGFSITSHRFKFEFIKLRGNFMTSAFGMEIDPRAITLPFWTLHCCSIESLRHSGRALLRLDRREYLLRRRIIDQLFLTGARRSRERHLLPRSARCLRLLASWQPR